MTEPSRIPVRHAHRGVVRRFVSLRRAGVGGVLALLAVLGPGLLAGLSDDDPAGVTTYSILGADFGYQLLWVIPVATVLLVLFHVLAVRLGVASGRGFCALIRDRYGARAAHVAAAGFLLANFGTICAEFAGVAAVAELFHVPRLASVVAAAATIIVLVVGSSFHRVERILLALSMLLASYVVAGYLAHPDWGAVAEGLVVPTVPASTAALVAIAATIGTTLAPWGLAFIQSYAVDKGLTRDHLGAERVEVVVGSLLTGIIGVFIAIACAATLRPLGIHIEDAADAARALEPAAGAQASLVFGVGLLGAALLAAAVVPLATAYSVAEAFGRRSDLDDPVSGDRFFYGTFAVLVALAATVVAIPGVPLIPLIFASQIVNAVFLPPQLVLLVRLNGDRNVVGDDAIGRTTSLLAWCGIGAVVVSIVALAAASLSGAA